jgi:hypothetical protein
MGSAQKRVHRRCHAAAAAEFGTQEIFVFVQLVTV